MAGRAVAVAPPVVGGQQVAERGQQVVVTAGAGLDHRDPRGGVRHEEAEQPVAFAGDERRAVAGEVEHRVLPAGPVAADLTAHGRRPLRRWSRHRPVAARCARPWRTAARRTRAGCRP